MRKTVKVKYFVFYDGEFCKEMFDEFSKIESETEKIELKEKKFLRPKMNSILS